MQSRSISADCRRLVALAAVTACACTHVGEFVWVDAYEPPVEPTRSVQLIEPGDLLNIRVWNQEALTGKSRVRKDGMISLPFVNDVQAAGMEAAVLGTDLQRRLKEFIVNPVVTVAIEEVAPFEVSIVGEVPRPGVYRLDPGCGVLKALATAGGISETAHRDRIFVVRYSTRPDGSRSADRIRFTYQALARAEGAAGTFRLRRGDFIVVE